MHTIEHLFATFARNSEHKDSVLYVGPMGCRTGFYLLVRASVSPENAIALVQASMRYIAAFDGEIPGNTSRECGNYLEHDLPKAKAVAADMVNILQGWTANDLAYKES
jgi:S-ribosylhomocysteine lyase